MSLNESTNIAIPKPAKNTAAPSASITVARDPKTADDTVIAGANLEEETP